MAKVIRVTSDETQDLATAINDLKTFVASASQDIRALCTSVAAISAAQGVTAKTASPGSHLDQSEVLVTAATASSAGTSLTLLKNLMNVYNFHIADTVVHVAADTVNGLSYTVAQVVGVTSGCSAANDLKTKYNLHCASTTAHIAADAGNTCSTTAASDQTSLNTLLNAMKTKVNAHLTAGPVQKSIRAVGA